MVKIEKVGGYWKFNENNILVNDSSVDNISEKWMEAILFSKNKLEKFFEKNNVEKYSVFLRGSVPRGNAIENISDLDFIILVEGDVEKETLSKETEDILKKFPFVEGIEFWVNDFSDIEKRTKLKLFLNQSIHISGKEINFPQIKKGSEFEVSLKDFTDFQNWYSKWQLSPVVEGDLVSQRCAWLSKKILRAGGELASRESEKYTRDLYFCWENFSEIYPEKEEEMKWILELFLNPISDKRKINHQKIKEIINFIDSKR